MNFINVKCISLNSDDWCSSENCYKVSADSFEKNCTSVHSIRTDEIADVEHRAYDLIVTSAATRSCALKYYYIKVHTPTGHGINGISSNVRVTEASYKRICNVLGINADIDGEEEIVY